MNRTPLRRRGRLTFLAPFLLYPMFGTWWEWAVTCVFLQALSLLGFWLRSRIALQHVRVLEKLHVATERVLAKTLRRD